MYIYLLLIGFPREKITSVPISDTVITCITMEGWMLVMMSFICANGGEVLLLVSTL